MFAQEMPFDPSANLCPRGIDKGEATEEEKHMCISLLGKCVFATCLFWQIVSGVISDINLEACAALPGLAGSPKRGTLSDRGPGYGDLE